jgi:hypothetical protein
MSLPEMGGSKTGLILLAQMKREKLKKDLPQIFQSCTFNRSVTSPFDALPDRYSTADSFVDTLVDKWRGFHLLTPRD